MDGLLALFELLGMLIEGFVNLCEIIGDISRRNDS
jgi:hypothetical protein